MDMMLELSECHSFGNATMHSHAAATTSSCSISSASVDRLGGRSPAFSMPRLSWPSSTDDIPVVGLVLIVSWAFILAALRHRKTHDDLIYEQQQLMLARTRLAQVMFEHSSREKKRSEYLSRKARLLEGAASFVATQVATGVIDASEADSQRHRVYDKMAREAAPLSADGKATCFGAEGLPEKMSAEHILEAAVDEVSGLPVDQLPGLRTVLGPSFASAFLTDMERVMDLLAGRMVETLSETMEKTTLAREKAAADPALLVYASGQKLTQGLELSRRVVRAMKDRRKSASVSSHRKLVGSLPMIGRLLAPKPQEAERHLHAKRTASRTLLRKVRQQQQGRFLRLVLMLSSSTVGYLALAYATTALNGVWSSLHTTLLADAARHATLSDGEWQAAVARDICAFTIIFVLEWWLNDFVSVRGRCPNPPHIAISFS